VTESDWKYSERVTPARRAKLAASHNYENLIRMVLNNAQGIWLRLVPGEAPGLTDCLQPIFTLDLPATGDALFNGPFGYRAQYWRSPEQGLAANALLIDALTPQLLASSATCSDPRLARLDLGSSIGAASAKFLDREGLFLNTVTADLDVEAWKGHANLGVELARRGLMAPVEDKFEVKGALLDPDGNEVVPAGKIRRHHQIHQYGWS
jgi:hypothetical protein